MLLESPMIDGAVAEDEIGMRIYSCDLPRAAYILVLLCMFRFLVVFLVRVESMMR